MLEEGYFGLDLLERLGIHVRCPVSRRAIFYASYRTRTQRARSPFLASTRARKTALTDAMKIPKGLQPLIEDGIVDEVVRSLKRGKEANIYIVRSGAQLRCAKVYRDLAQRSFQRRTQ